VGCALGFSESQMRVIRFVNSLASRMTQVVPWCPSAALLPTTAIRRQEAPNSRGIEAGTGLGNLLIA
jgi:hypothetical protein